MSGKKSSGNRDTRTRNWSFIIYPDSAPSNWRTILDDMHLEWIESPLHDKDINGNGEQKKAHIHILILFGGVKAYEQVKEITDKLGQPIPERVHNVKSLVRYMAHLDNPEKAQYSINDIKAHGGIDVQDLLKPSSSERYDLIRQMVQFVDDNHIIEFMDLVNYAAVNEYETWFPLLCDNCAYFIGQYIKSQRHSKQDV